MTVDNTESALRPSQVGWFAASRLVPGVLALASIPIWLWLFGAEVYGRFAIASAVVTVAASLSTGWLRQAALRYTGTPGRGLLDHPFSVLAAPVGVATVATTGCLVALMWGSLSLPTALLASAVAATFSVYFLTQTSVQRDGGAARFAVAESARVAVTLVVSLLLSSTQLDGVDVLLLASTLGNVVGVVATSIGVSRAPFRRVDAHPSKWTLARESWQFGWPLSIWLAVSSLTIYGDRFVLQYFAEPATVGVYSAAADVLVRGYAMAAAPILLLLHPNIMRAYNQGRVAEAYRRIYQGIRLLLVIALVSLPVVILAGPELLSAVLGGLEPRRSTVALLGTGAVLWQLALLVHKPLELLGRTRTMLVVAGSALLCQLVVSLALVAPLGVDGVATGFLCGCLFYLAACSRWLRPTGGPS